MNKALTIEELKALEVGDWVWLIREDEGEYYRLDDIFSSNCYSGAVFDTIHQWISLDLGQYGKTWLAYKNKEQAEGKENEIRKEAAKEIFQLIYDTCDKQEDFLVENREKELDEYRDYSFYEGELSSLGLIKNEVLLNAKEYGVEVDE